MSVIVFHSPSSYLRSTLCRPVYIVYLCLGGAAVVLCYVVYLRGLKITG